MRSVSSTLLDHFNSSLTTTVVDLFTITLATATVYRWTNHAVDLTTDGFTWTAGGTGTAPLPARGGIRDTIGLDPSELEVRLDCGTSAEIGSGVKAQLAALNGVLDGATVKLERAYLDSAGAVIGSILRFQGQTSEVRVTDFVITMSVRSELEQLNVKLPRHLHRPLCSHALFDAGCGLTRSDFTTTGSVQAGTTDSVVKLNILADTGYYNGGALTFTSGALSGTTRTISTYVNSGGVGNFTLDYPLESTPAGGVTASVYPGCDKSIATCRDTFLNLPRRRGSDFVPTPDMVVP